MTNITEKEARLLDAILNSEYHDGSPIEERAGYPIWVDCACEGFGPAAGGIMASLVQKGLAGTDGECCWVTREGLAAAEAGS